MKKALIFSIRLYQWILSPLLGPSCRFTPSCSEYARQAIEQHNSLRGTGMAIKRLLRCQPFAEAGYDPVPPSKSNPEADL